MRTLILFISIYFVSSVGFAQVLDLESTLSKPETPELIQRDLFPIINPGQQVYLEVYDKGDFYRGVPGDNPYGSLNIDINAISCELDYVGTMSGPIPSSTDRTEGFFGHGQCLINKSKLSHYYRVHYPRGSEIEPHAICHEHDCDFMIKVMFPNDLYNTFHFGKF